MTKYKFIYWLRFIGVSLIVYDHMGLFMNPEWKVGGLINYLINRPLHMIQYFGAFGVSLFFVISGFCLIASQENGRSFLYNKIIKLYGTLILSMIAFYVFNVIISRVDSLTYWSQFNVQNWIEGITLICYLKGEGSVINGALWYLFTLLFFEICFGIFYRYAKKNALYFAAIMDTFFIVILVIVKEFEIEILQMQWLVLGLIMIFGILIRCICEKKISIRLFIISMIINYLVLLLGLIVFCPNYYENEPYMISVVYAVLLFAIFLCNEKYMYIPPFVKFISSISFSIYLFHMTIGGLIITSLVNRGIGFTFSFIIAIAGTILLAWANYSWIELKIIASIGKFVNNKSNRFREGSL